MSTTFKCYCNKYFKVHQVIFKYNLYLFKQELINLFSFEHKIIAEFLLKITIYFTYINFNINQFYIKWIALMVDTKLNL